MSNVLNKCKIKEDEVLIIGDEKDFDFLKQLAINVLEENIKITEENKSLPILFASELKLRLFSKNRTSDLLLAENGINSFADLQAAYFLIQYKKFSASRRIRELVINKYANVLEYYEITPRSNSETSAVGSTSSD